MAEARRVDEYGNPILRVDEYGNPIRDQPAAYGTGGTGVHGTGATGGRGHGTGEYGTGTGGYGTTTQMHEGMVTGGTGAQHQPQRVKEVHGGGGATGVLQRSGSSSSSSSSEDDGMGGRRKKKGLKEKIKEKLPGTHKSDEEKAQTHTPTTMPTGTAATTTAGTERRYGEEHEKKGIMEKIKEKLPGGHHN